MRFVKSNLVIDLDGTLLEGQQRHYRCYVDILKQFQCSPLPIEDYWADKREGKRVEELLSRSHAESHTATFRQEWLRLIETEKYLNLDTVHPGVTEKLSQWKLEGKQLILLTQRQSVERLFCQLDLLGMRPYWDEILVASQSSNKAARLCELQGLEPAKTLWIGDTEADIEGAREFGCASCAVTCGLRSEPFLRALKPNYLIATLDML